MLPFDPKKPLFGFSAKFPHAKRRIHLFADEQFSYFRPKNAPEDWWGALSHMESFRWLVEESRWEQLKRELRPALRQGHFFRLLHLPDPRSGEKRMWHILWRPDFCYAVPVGHCADLNGAYFWPCATRSHLWKTPTVELQRHFESEWSDPQSDVRAALPWCDLTPEEREKRGLCWIRGDLGTLQKLVRAGVQMLPIWDDLPSWDARDSRNFALSWSEHGQSVQADFPIMMSREAHILWKELCFRIEWHNRAAYDLPNGTRDDWIIPWGDYESPRTSKRWVSLWLDIPKLSSEHERLEAGLFLRDWLSQHAPDLLSDWFPDAA